MIYPGFVGIVGFVGLAGLLGIRGRPPAHRVARWRVARLKTRDVRADRDPADPAGRTSRWVPLITGAAVGVTGLALFGLVGALVAAAVTPLLSVGVRRLGSTPVTLGDRRDRDRLPVVLDLIAAALGAGAPTSVAVMLAAPAAPPSLQEPLRRAAGLLELGADPAEAWASVQSHATIERVAIIAARSADSGIRLADGLIRYAGELRSQLRVDGVRRAHRAAAFGLLPLGLCFLPAFVLLGIVPVVVGIAGDAFAPLGR